MLEFKQEQNQKITTNPWFARTVILSFLGLSFLNCWIILFPNWQAHDIVPPGDDPAVHLQIITNILAGKGWLIGLPYPPLFHWIVATLAFVTHINAIEAQWAVTTAILGLIPITVAGLFAIKVSDKRLAALIIGILCTAVMLLLSHQPLQAWGDGNYPNMLAEGILLPLLIYCLNLLHDKWKMTTALATITILALIFATHAMSILIALVVFGAGVLLIDLSISQKLQLAGGAIFLTLVAWLKVVGPTISLSTIHSLLAGQSNIVPGLSTAYSTITPIREFSLFFGQPFFIVAIALLSLVVTMYIFNTSSRYLILLLGIWCISLFLASRVHGLAVPDRFLRDMSYPLIALSTVGITLLARRSLLAVTPVILLLCWIGIRFPTVAQYQFGSFVPHPNGIRAIEQRIDHNTAMEFIRIGSHIPANAAVVTNLTTSYAPFLLNHATTALETTSLGTQTLPYYIVIGPESGGSLKSPEQSDIYGNTTKFLKGIPGIVIAREKHVELIRVTAKSR